jgi:hypothetical protein
MPANLTYYVWEGVLTGYANGRMVHLCAASGGGGGSTAHRASFRANNPYMTPFKTVGGAHDPGHIHGGPLPPGKYTICKPARHVNLGLSAELKPFGPLPGGRSDFFIHGRGPHGSDGCIVPLDPGQFRRLMEDLSASQGGTLIVAETMSDQRLA